MGLRRRWRCGLKRGGLIGGPDFGNKDGVMGTTKQRESRKGRRYSAEEKAQAVRLVRTLRDELGTSHGTVQRVANRLGYGLESVRSWVRQADGLVGGMTTAEKHRIAELEQESRELKRANSILKSALAFFAAASTAHIGDGRLHRPTQSGVRGRAHMRNTAGGPQHLLRGFQGCSYTRSD